MANYIIGDVHGCFSTLQELLAMVEFNAGVDTIIFLGDLVNRGPQSLETLRFIKQHDYCMKTILGNHDLYLLSLSLNKNPTFKKKDTLAPILAAKEASSLIGWLRQQPLYYHLQDLLLIHAGIYPIWTLQQIKENGDELTTWLQGDDYAKLLINMYGNQPDNYSIDLTGFEKLRFNLNVFTRMRVLYKKDYRLNFDFKHPLNELSSDLDAWFHFTNPALNSLNVFFGHWSALGFHEYKNITCLDSGVVWGGYLTAYHLETKEVVSVKNNTGVKLF